MNEKTNHAFIVYKIQGSGLQTMFGASYGLSFAASLPDRISGEEWIIEYGKKGVNYTILEVFRKP